MNVVRPLSVDARLNFIQFIKWWQDKMDVAQSVSERFALTPSDFL
jgi:hypothetical protein